MKYETVLHLNYLSYSILFRKGERAHVTSLSFYFVTLFFPKLNAVEYPASMLVLPKAVSQGIPDVNLMP